MVSTHGRLWALPDCRAVRYWKSWASLSCIRRVRCESCHTEHCNQPILKSHWLVLEVVRQCSLQCAIFNENGRPDLLYAIADEQDIASGELVELQDYSNGV